MKTYFGGLRFMLKNITPIKQKADLAELINGGLSYSKKMNYNINSLT